ncbi:hypothetical protein QCA50_018061 [Cerrena zonata]|uniref:Uncharacterized protein n=1 Tax=Cerrena zonata TaxID=2478898 RepID=A0AAW0FE75_9APHY
MQWQLPKTFSNWIQRARRVARGKLPNGQPCRGIAILLVEPSVYSLDPGAVTASSIKIGNLTRRGKQAKMANPKAHAIVHGLGRGWIDKQDDIPQGSQPELNLERDDEGLLTFVQSTSCQRQVWAQAFDCESLAEENCTVPCCDICEPQLLDLTRPGRSNVTQVKLKLKRKGLVIPRTQTLLEDWRMKIFQRDWFTSQLDSTAILDDSTVALLASVGTLSSIELERPLSGSWIWWDTYGNEFTDFFNTISTEYQPKPRTRKQRRDTTTDNVKESVPSLLKSEDIIFTPENPGPPIVSPLIGYAYESIQFVFESGSDGHTQEKTSATPSQILSTLAAYPNPSATPSVDHKPRPRPRLRKRGQIPAMSDPFMLPPRNSSSSIQISGPDMSMRPPLTPLPGLLHYAGNPSTPSTPTPFAHCSTLPQAEVLPLLGKSQEGGSAVDEAPIYDPVLLTNMRHATSSHESPPYGKAASGVLLSRGLKRPLVDEYVAPVQKNRDRWFVCTLMSVSGKMTCNEWKYNTQLSSPSQ